MIDPWVNPRESDPEEIEQQHTDEKGPPSRASYHAEGVTDIGIFARGKKNPF